MLYTEFMLKYLTEQNIARTVTSKTIRTQTDQICYQTNGINLLFPCVKQYERSRTLNVLSSAKVPSIPINLYINTIIHQSTHPSIHQAIQPASQPLIQPASQPASDPPQVEAMPKKWNPKVL